MRSRSEIQSYLCEISRFPLLTAEQERELGRAVVATGCPVSRRKLIEANLRLVVLFAKQYANPNASLEDLIEEGNLGLLRAADRFDPAHGVRFSTYASWWIKQSIRRVLVRNTQAMHLPRYVVEMSFKLNHVSRTLERRFSRPASDAELATALSIPLRTVHTIQHASSVMNAVAATPIGTANEQRPLVEVQAAAAIDRPGDAICVEDEHETLGRLLLQINDRDAEILRLRFGHGWCRPMTLKEIADKFGVSRERIRQICDDAISQLQRMWLDESARPTTFQSAHRACSAAEPLPSSEPRSPSKGRLVNRNRRTNQGLRGQGAAAAR